LQGWALLHSVAEHNRLKQIRIAFINQKYVGLVPSHLNEG
jgi:hypothetical protein